MKFDPHTSESPFPQRFKLFTSAIESALARLSANASVSATIIIFRQTSFLMHVTYCPLQVYFFSFSTATSYLNILYVQLNTMMRSHFYANASTDIMTNRTSRKCEKYSLYIVEFFEVSHTYSMQRRSSHTERLLFLYFYAHLCTIMPLPMVDVILLIMSAETQRAACHTCRVLSLHRQARAFSEELFG